MKRIVVTSEEVRVGDYLPTGSRIAEVSVESVGPDWIVAAWIEGGDRDGSGLPSITWPVDTEVEVYR